MFLLLAAVVIITTFAAVASFVPGYLVVVVALASILVFLSYAAFTLGPQRLSEGGVVAIITQAVQQVVLLKNSVSKSDDNR